jgi:hypothetical protein
MPLAANAGSVFITTRASPISTGQILLRIESPLQYSYTLGRYCWITNTDVGSVATPTRAGNRSSDSSFGFSGAVRLQRIGSRVVADSGRVSAVATACCVVIVHPVRQARAADSALVTWYAAASQRSNRPRSPAADTAMIGTDPWTA